MEGLLSIGQNSVPRLGQPAVQRGGAAVRLGTLTEPGASLQVERHWPREAPLGQSLPHMV